MQKLKSKKTTAQPIHTQFNIAIFGPFVAVILELLKLASEYTNHKTTAVMCEIKKTKDVKYIVIGTP